MFDTVISGAQLVFPNSPVYAGNIGINAGKIAAITSRDIRWKANTRLMRPGSIFSPESSSRTRIWALDVVLKSLTLR